MSTPKISVIIPVYNVEKYLKKCVESVLSQTLKDIEIILVDDGSPDNCPIICDEYAKKDNRIVVIHKQNGGLSDARNAGMRIAKGKYIGFVDSDDYIEPDMFEKMYQIADKDGSDVVVCNIWLDYEYKNCKNSYWPLVANGSVSKDEIYNYMYKYPSYAVNKIYKRSFLCENNIDFIKGYLYEDVPFFTQVMLLAKKVSYCIDNLYFYRLGREGAITNKKSAKQLDIVCIVNIVENLLKSLNAPANVFDNFYKWKIEIYTWMYNLLPDDKLQEGLNAINALDDDTKKQILDKISMAKVKVFLFNKIKILKFKTKRYNLVEKVFKYFSPIITIKKV